MSTTTWLDNPMRRFERIIFYGLVTLTAVGAGMFGYMASDTQPPRTDVIGSTDRRVYRPGETIIDKWSMVITRDCPGFITRYLTFDATKAEGLKHRLPPQSIVPGETLSPLPSDLPAAVQRRLDPFQLPVDAPAGQGWYHVEVAFECNAFQRMFHPLYFSYPAVSFCVRVGTEPMPAPCDAYNDVRPEDTILNENSEDLTRKRY